uniref:Uncharacterized protein n=1 Tax=Anguilla anguilla TaxID=7936 RepID=A0A0E9QSA4_ANGAN
MTKTNGMDLECPESREAWHWGGGGGQT